MRQRLSRYKVGRVIGTSSLALLVVLMLALLYPSVGISTNAANTDAVVLEAGVNLGSNISLAIQSSLDIDVAPSGDVSYNKNTAKLTVSTNNSSGYSLFMQAMGDSADLSNTDLTITESIMPLETASTLEMMQTNTWGYNIERIGNLDKNRIYYPVSTSLETIYETGGTSYNDEYALTFGVATGSDLPQGRYTREVVISATANPMVITSLANAEYMQDITSDICRNTDTHVTKRLTDYRDGKKYWVAKLKDGNCWMTQNLALTLNDFNDGEGIRAVMADGISKGALLTPANTDIEESWNTSSPYPPKVTSKSPFVSPANTADSWDFGEYVWTKAANPVSCSSQTGVDPLSKCPATAGFVNVSGSDWQASNVEIDSGDIAENGIYDAHYLVGNYYTFTAATAGKGPTVTGSQANVENSSICPKGWKLPTSGSNYNAASDSFYNLLKAYGAETSNAAASTIIRAKPLYLILGGQVDYSASGGPINEIGSHGHFSSSVSSGSGSDYLLEFTSSSVDANRSLSRQFGISVRCLVR